MPVVIALVGQKGGIGKSTLTLALAVELYLRGYRVLVVDADEEQATSRTWADVAEESEIDAPTVVCMGDNLRTQLPKLAEGYDVVLIDTPGRNGRRTTYALGLCSLAILPCGATGPELWAMNGTIDQLKDVQALRACDAAILVTRKQPGTVIGRRARAALEETEIDVLETELHARLAYAEAISGGRGPTTYEPTGEASAEVRRLVDELVRRLGLEPKKKATHDRKKTAHVSPSTARRRAAREQLRGKCGPRASRPSTRASDET